jgi:hypothetical protein
MLPETSMSAGIPALHAGMTQWRSCIETNQKALHLSYFKGGVEEHDVYNESDLAFV